MKHIAKIQCEFLRISKSLDVDKLKKKGKPTIFLGGFTKNNDWREQIIKEFLNKFSFLDPYDKNWKAEDNIYDECYALLNADYVVFFKGGELTKKEKELLEKSNKEYRSFDTVEELKNYLKQIN